MSRVIVELRGIHAAYLRKEILRGVSLTVSAGEVVAILGDNGTGKSTTLRVVAGLLHPSSGCVCYQGRDLARLDTAQRQRLGVAYLMQGGRVFPNLTVEENHALAARSAVHSGRGAAPLGEYFPLLYGRRSDRAGLLSGGQRQMLAVEMVLTQKPSLLLLDEPTAAMTSELASNVLSTLSRYVKERSAAALLVEQNVGAAMSVAHRHVILANGTFTKETTSDAPEI